MQESENRKFLRPIKIRNKEITEARKEYEQNYRQSLIEDINLRVTASGNLINEIPSFTNNSSIPYLESIRLSLLTDQELQYQIPLFAERFEAVAGKPPPYPLPIADASSDSMRSWVSQTSWEGYRLHGSNRAKYIELGTHIKLFSKFVGLMVALVIICFFVIDWIPSIVIIPPFVLAMFAGSLGGSINHLRLLTSPKLPKGTDILSYELELLSKSAIGTALAGALFGVVIQVLAASGVFASFGDLAKILPVIERVKIGTDPNWIIVKEQAGLMPVFLGRPPSNELAKLLAWCFASGFIPNLVPDIVESLYKKQQK